MCCDFEYGHVQYLSRHRNYIGKETEEYPCKTAVGNYLVIYTLQIYNYKFIDVEIYF